jgi:hypothetical protein
MKKKQNIYFIIIVLLILVFEGSTNAQNYNIRFAATGGAVTKLDSVKVENLNQGTKLSLPGEDTLHLGTLGIDDGANQETIKIYPNPMQGLAELSFYAKASGYA